MLHMVNGRPCLPLSTLALVYVSDPTKFTVTYCYPLLVSLRCNTPPLSSNASSRRNIAKRNLDCESNMFAITKCNVNTVESKLWSSKTMVSKFTNQSPFPLCVQTNREALRSAMGVCIYATKIMQISFRFSSIIGGSYLIIIMSN